MSSTISEPQKSEFSFQFDYFVNMLTGLKVLVTGASSGIGRASCKVMTSHGATVFGIGRNEDNLKDMVREKSISSYVVADLAVENECERAGSIPVTVSEIKCLIVCLFNFVYC